MDQDINDHLKRCQKCQVHRPSHQPPEFLSPLPQCTEPNQRVHADLFGPLKTSTNGKKYILVMTDAFSKYVELVAIPDKEAFTTATEFFNRWICRFGVPNELITDRGKEFTNELSKELYTLLDLKHTLTSVRHPQCNSQAEVCNKTIAKYLARFVDASTLDWELYLPPLMFS
jgi:transposase InsO family protein